MTRHILYTISAAAQAAIELRKARFRSRTSAIIYPEFPAGFFAGASRDGAEWRLCGGYKIVYQ